MCTCVLLVVACWDAEGNEATAKEASNKAEDQTEDPGKRTFFLVQVSHTCVFAMLALHSNWVFWPVARWVCTTVMRVLIYYDDLLLWHGLHYGLTRLYHHDGLTWLLGGVLRLSHWLSHGLRSVHWLLNQRLLLGCDCAYGCVSNWFTIHVTVLKL